MKEQERLRCDRILFSCPFARFYYQKEKAKLFESPLYRDLTPLEYFFIKFPENTYLQPSVWLQSRKLADLAGPWWNLRSPDDDGEYFCRVVAASRGIRFVPGIRTYWRVGNNRSFSWAWRGSKAAQDATFQSACRCIEHFRKLEDSEASRAACVTFLQNRFGYFYPDNTEIVNKMHALARELGGVIFPPHLKWKYKWIHLLFGRQAARRAELFLPMLRSSVVVSWDRFTYNLSGHARRHDI